MYKNLLQQIQKYSTIVLYRHTNPDYDAYGSQFGLKNWIEENFPEKKVYAMGIVESPLYQQDTIGELQDFLAIVLDVSNKDRIDGTLLEKAKYIIKIDHHPNVEQFENLFIGDVKYAATCEIIAEFCRTYDDQYCLSKKSAEILYRGLLTDTLAFKTNNTTSNSLLMASYLASKGIDIYQTNVDVFNKSYAEFKFISYLRSKVIFDHQYARVILTEEELKPFNLTNNQAKSYVAALGGINDFEIWGIYVKDSKGLYAASLRSLRVTINDIASQYIGGGHKNACGIRDLTQAQFDELQTKLIARIQD